MSQNSIQVWDPLVRIFHWSLVVFFGIAFLSGDEDSSLHIYAGYTVVGLVLFRILWGFIGTENARFKDFIYGPFKVVQYVKSLVRGSPQHYVGHNPAGGYMVALLLATLLVVTFSGLKVYGTEGHGPLTASAEISVVSTGRAEVEDDGINEAGKIVGKEGEEFWEKIHEASSYFMLALIALHILGVLISSRLHKENLVKAMITGEKNVE